MLSNTVLGATWHVLHKHKTHGARAAEVPLSDAWAVCACVGKTVSPNKENRAQPSAPMPSNNAGTSGAAAKADTLQQLKTAASTSAAPESTPVPSSAAALKPTTAGTVSNKTNSSNGTAKQQKSGSQGKRLSSSQPKAVPTPSPAGSGGAAVDHGGGTGAEIVGRRIKVWWPKDAAWYEGTVAEFQDGKHKGESLGQHAGPLTAVWTATAAAATYGLSQAIELRYKQRCQEV